MKAQLNTLAWRKITHEKWADSWQERLLWIGWERLAITQLSGSNRVRLEIYNVTESEAAKLKKEFGGEVRNLSRSTADWVKSIVQKQPISIRGRLRIANSEPPPDRVTDGKAIFIPAGLAFGTGEHATTAGCLRLLCDIIPRNKSPWSFLDVGTGTGILAIAAAKLGANRVDAIDWDATAVKTAKQNCRLNDCAKLVRVWRENVLKLQKPAPYEVVAANLYSTLLREAAPKLIQVTCDNGFLIFSGILRDQTSEVAEWLRELALEVRETRTRGKWTALLARKRAIRLKHDVRAPAGIPWLK